MQAVPLAWNLFPKLCASYAISVLCGGRADERSRGIARLQVSEPIGETAGDELDSLTLWTRNIGKVLPAVACGSATGAPEGASAVPDPRDSSGTQDSSADGGFQCAPSPPNLDS